MLRKQDGYPSRLVVHWEPFALNDPSHVQEEDIIRLRQVLPTFKRVIPASKAPSKANKAKKKKEEKRKTQAMTGRPRRRQRQ